MKKIMILGSGGWGIAFGIMCAGNGHAVTIWTPFEEERALLVEKREHTALLKGVRIPESISFTCDISAAADADITVVAVPSAFVSQTAAKLRGVIAPGATVVSLSKGLDGERLMLMSQLIREEVPDCRLCVISGPSHAEEVARSMPTVVVAASDDADCAKYIQSELSCDTFRIYTSDDVAGVEIAGAVKNVMALAAGVLDGLGFEDNTKAALMTRGISEISRLGTAMGGNSSTFLGLAGIGDLIVTCTSMHSRNRRAGILIGQGHSAEQTLKEIGMTVEGYATTKAAYNLAKANNVEMPIVTQVYKVLYEGKNPRDAIRELMGRPMRAE